MKPYKAKSIQGAQSEVRNLRRQIKSSNELLNRWAKERVLLAKLASESAQFFNPLDAMEAKKVRDSIMRHNG